MIAFSQCGFVGWRVLGPGAKGWPQERCQEPAAFVGVSRGGHVAVVCSAHRGLVCNPVPIPGTVVDDDETLARVAENQAAMDELLDSVGGN